MTCRETDQQNLSKLVRTFFDFYFLNNECKKAKINSLFFIMKIIEKLYI